MCGRYTLTSTPDAMREQFGYAGRPNFPPRYNIAPTQPVAVVRGDAAARRYALMRWGLVPGWARDVRDVPLLINARAESALVKPSFRDAMRTRRCLIPADGFYEWRAVTPARRQAYLIRRPDRAPFAFAGLWERWLDAQGNELDSVAIVTCDANAALAPIHHRMPVILDEAAFDAWLDVDGVRADRAAALLAPAPDDLLETIPISNRVNSVANDDAAIQEPVDETEGAAHEPLRQAAQLDLF